MSNLQLIGVVFLTVAALMALGLSFYTDKAPANFRNALYALFFAQIASAAFLAYDQLNGILGIIAVASALIYVIGVVLYNRTIMLTTYQRLVPLRNPRFWATSVVSIAAIIVLMIVNHYQH